MTFLDAQTIIESEVPTGKYGFFSLGWLMEKFQIIPKCEPNHIGLYFGNVDGTPIEIYKSGTGVSPDELENLKNNLFIVTGMDIGYIDFHYAKDIYELLDNHADCVVIR